MLLIPWTQKNSNVTVLKEVDARRSLISRIRKQQATSIGHVIRRHGLEHLVTTGILEGNRSRGRQREKTLDGVTSWLGAQRVTDILSTINDREAWKGMIANAME